MKRCAKCSRIKSFTAFYPDPTRHLGVSFYCKVCQRRGTRRRRPTHHASRETPWRRMIAADARRRSS